MGTITPIRSGITIPERPSDEDEMTAFHRRIAMGFLGKVGNGKDGLSDQQRCNIGEGLLQKKLPRNNLRLIVQPASPRKEWFAEMRKRAEIAIRAHDLTESRWSLAYHLDQLDGGDRQHAPECDRTRARREMDNAILDALRTPATRLGDIRRKQEMVGKREWALEWRPDLQAIIDEEEARLRARPKPRTGREAQS